MPAISTLKSSRTREKRALVKENTEAGTLLQAELSDNLPEMLKLNLSIGKVLLNLQTKLARLETANDKLVEALEQTEDTAASEQFQSTLDEESEMIDDCISKISQLKVMKEGTEKRRKELESTQTLGLEQTVTQVQEQVDRLNSAHSTPTLSGHCKALIQYNTIQYCLTPLLKPLQSHPNLRYPHSIGIC